MLPRSRRGFQSVNVANQERVRTHLLFSSKSEHMTAKRKRRTHNKFHQMLHGKKDETVQTTDELDPSQWTGNQRILHFGPMAQRDPFFYYYPKGWDVLYAAQFGFFPYRTNKFRGSSSVVCIWAFAIFLCIGGALMIYLGYFVFHRIPFWVANDRQMPHIPPIQIAGPILLAVGLLLVVLGLVCSISTSEFLNEKFRHYYHRGQPSSVTVYTTHFKQPRAIYETNPYQPPPPPAYPVLENHYVDASLLNPNAELKLYPPVMPGHSTLSLHGHTPNFLASPYNTLRAMSVNRYPSATDNVYENPRTGSMAPGTGASSRRQSITSMARRAKSAGAVQRTPSNRSR